MQITFFLFLTKQTFLLFSLHEESCLFNENCFKYFKIKLGVQSAQHREHADDYLSGVPQLHNNQISKETYKLSLS